MKIFLSITIVLTISFALKSNEIEVKNLPMQEASIAFDEVIFDEYLLGGGAANNGFVIKCEGKPPVMLEYFEATLPTLKVANPTPLYDKKNMLSYFFNTFKTFSNFYDIFSNSMFYVGDPLQWISTDYKTTDDTGMIYKIAPEICTNPTLISVTAQQDETVFVNENYFNQLSPKQQQLLIIHEALYYIGINFGKISTSSKVRQIIRHALKSNFKKHILETPAKVERMRLLIESLLGKTVKIKYDINPDKKRDTIAPLLKLTKKYYLTPADQDRTITCRSEKGLRLSINLINWPVVNINLIAIPLNSFISKSNQHIHAKVKIHNAKGLHHFIPVVSSDKPSYGIFFYRLPSEQIFLKFTKKGQKDIFALCD